MIHMLHAAVKDALDAGFAGLCAAGDMSWLLDEADGSERIAEYEARLNEFYPSSRALGLCLYNRNRLPAATLDHASPRSSPGSSAAARLPILWLRRFGAELQFTSLPRFGA